jgi:hypothetical protein
MEAPHFSPPERLRWALSCDPGTRHPGFALWFDETLHSLGWGWKWWPRETREDGFWSFLPSGHLNALIIEGQHFETERTGKKGKKFRIPPQDIMKLSFSAGRLFERFDAEAKFIMPVSAWRDGLWPGCQRITKEKVLERFEQDFPAHHERVLKEKVPRSYRGDVSEAILVGEAFFRARRRGVAGLFLQEQ